MYPLILILTTTKCTAILNEPKMQHLPGTQKQTMFYKTTCIFCPLGNLTYTYKLYGEFKSGGNNLQCQGN